MSMGEGLAPEVLKFYEQLKKEAEEAGYYLNPDKEFTLKLVAGLLTNKERYGYPACPCRLPLGQKEKDIDIICPCYYRDSDIEEFGACYCALYVSEDWINGKISHRSIPERRPPQFVTEGYTVTEKKEAKTGVVRLAYPVWRCQVCGYLCARAEPPGKCPICKATKDRFEQFI